MLVGAAPLAAADPPWPPQPDYANYGECVSQGLVDPSAGDLGPATWNHNNVDFPGANYPHSRFDTYGGCTTKTG